MAERHVIRSLYIYFFFLLLEREKDIKGGGGVCEADSDAFLACVIDKISTARLAREIRAKRRRRRQWAERYTLNNERLLLLFLPYSTPNVYFFFRALTQSQMAIWKLSVDCHSGRRRFLCYLSIGPITNTKRNAHSKRSVDTKRPLLFTLNLSKSCHDFLFPRNKIC